MSQSDDYSSMISKFGTEDVRNGELTGTTDTDYFYFLCPKCNDGGTEVMRIINYGNSDDFKFRTDDGKPKIKKPFHFSFELFCDKCKTHTVVKLTNVNGLLGGSIVGTIHGLKHKVIGPNKDLHI